jgi:hypothetical protein
VSVFTASYLSKTSWTLQLVVDEGTLDAPNNRSYVSWSLRLYRGDTSTPWNNAGSSYSVSGPGGLSGTFPAFRFGSTGTGVNYSSIPVGGYVEIASGGAWVTHNPDGSGSATLSASHAAAATLGTATIGSSSFPLTTLRQVPSVPASVALAYSSDTQLNLTWDDTSPTNGLPVTNQVQTSVNGGSFTQVASISAAESLVLSAAANQKIVARVRSTNTAGSSAFSADSAPVFTTPAAPSGVVASKDASLDITVAWTPNVGFTEHQHVVEHGTVTGGVTTWDASPLATVAAGTVSYKHVAPNPSQVHVYRVRARNTDTAARQSGTVLSNEVQLLAAPNAPTLPDLPSFADRALALVLVWAHNSVDTTPQTAYEVGFSTNGGSSWTSTGKVTSTVSARTIAANTYAANVPLTVRVRTWGNATSGGSDGTGASPWSTLDTVTFKTRPVATITSPVASPSYASAQLRVALGFSQAESAAFVSATIQLFSGATLLEERTSTTLAETIMSTRVGNGLSYTLKVTVTDSNGITSDLVTRTFSVTYTEPVAAVVSLTYLSDSGIAQIGITIPAPGVGEAAAVAVSIVRTIDGVSESIVEEFAASSSLTILDTTPTIYGDNVYTVSTISGDGATTEVVETLTTAEEEWAFMSTGPGYSQIIRFGGELKPQVTPSVDSKLVKTSGRSRSIGLYAPTGDLVLSGTGEIVTGLGSSAEEIEAFLLIPRKGCYRDPTGRRLFGQIKGQISRDTFMLGSFTYTVSETS